MDQCHYVTSAHGPLAHMTTVQFHGLNRIPVTWEALGLTICWPAASPDVSGGGNCTGHLGELICTPLNGAQCTNVGNVFTGGFSDNNIKDHDPDIGVLKTVFCRVENNNNNNCSGSTQKAKVGCVGVVEGANPVPL